MEKEYQYEMAKVLTKGLGRSLTDEEIRMIYWLGDSDTRVVLLNLFKELVEKIEYYKED